MTIRLRWRMRDINFDQSQNCATKDLQSEAVKSPSALNFTRLSERKIAAFAWLLCLFLVAAPFASLVIRLHYSVDSFNLISDQRALWYLSLGRYTLYYLTLFVDFIGLNLVLDQRIFLALCIFALATSIYIVSRLFARLLNSTNKYLILFLCVPTSLIWVNVFIVDLLLFPEAAIEVTVGSLSVSAAACFSLKDGRVGHVVLSALFLLIALGCYQSYVGFFVSITLIGTFLKYKDISVKAMLTSWIRSIVVGLLCCLINVLLIRFFVVSGIVSDSGRGASLSISSIFANLLSTIEYQIPLWTNADGLMPPFVMPLLFLLCVGCVLFASARMTSIKLRFLYFLAIGMSYLAAFSAHYVEAQVFFTPRSNIAVWCVVGCVLASSAGILKSHLNASGSHLRSSSNEVGFLRKAALMLFLMTGFVYAVSAYTIIDIAYDKYCNNIQDFNYATAVAERIQEYEDETGNIVDSIVCKRDVSAEITYPGVRYDCYELGWKIMLTDYSNWQLVNFVGGLDLQPVSDEAGLWDTFFGGKDWINLNLDEQLVIQDNVAYLALY